MSVENLFLQRAKNADRAVRAYAVSKLKANEAYKNMFKKNQDIAIEKMKKNVNAKRFLKKISDMYFSRIIFTN